MDTDKKITEETNITGGEKDTLHNAGVDLSSEEKGETFVDIDSAPSVGDDPDLKKIGLNFVEKENKEDLSLLKEQMDKKNSLDSANQGGVTPQPVSSQVTPEPKKEESSASVSDLEQEFNQTVGQKDEPKTTSLNEKVTGLRGMLVKIQEKLGLKKKEVQKELDDLKHVKEDIAKGIGLIKELEESKDKIEKQLGKVEAISGEISNIEKEVEEELNS